MENIKKKYKENLTSIFKYKLVNSDYIIIRQELDDKPYSDDKYILIKKERANWRKLIREIESSIDGCETLEELYEINKRYEDIGGKDDIVK